MAQKLTAEDRKRIYLAQTGRKELTSKQRRRIRKKQDAARGKK